MYCFKVTIGSEVIYPKGFYYQGKHVIIVGDIIKGHTIRRKELASNVEIEVSDKPFVN